MTKMTNKFWNLSKLVHPGWFLHSISLYLQKNSIFGIKSASLHKISLFAVNDLPFYPFELHIFPSPTYRVRVNTLNKEKDLTKCWYSVNLNNVARTLASKEFHENNVDHVCVFHVNTELYWRGAVMF